MEYKDWFYYFIGGLDYPTLNERKMTKTKRGSMWGNLAVTCGLFSNGIASRWLGAKSQVLQKKS